MLEYKLELIEWGSHIHKFEKARSVRRTPVFINYVEVLESVELLQKFQELIWLDIFRLISAQLHGASIFPPAGAENRFKARVRKLSRHLRIVIMFQLGNLTC